MLAGSSLPVTWRRPELELKLGTVVEDALVAAYGPIEVYGFHALEALQAMIERREGGAAEDAALRSGVEPGAGGVPVQELAARAAYAVAALLGTEAAVLPGDHSAFTGENPAEFARALREVLA